jgi:hypothetical protein
MPTTKPRHSIPLTETELAEIAAARTPGTAEHEAVRELTGVEANSVASTLRAVLALGWQALHERVAEYSYAAEAASDHEGPRARRALRDRLLARAAADEA